jgi:HEPN domain-containing protein
MKPASKDWMNSAGDDLKVIEKIIDSDYLSNMIAFHSQQCIEKCFKAILEEKEMTIPKTHDLLKLYDSVKIYITISDTDLLSIVSDIYTDARYPGTTGLLPSGKPSQEEAVQFYAFANKIFSLVADILR